MDEAIVRHLDDIHPAIPLPHQAGTRASRQCEQEKRQAEYSKMHLSDGDDSCEAELAFRNTATPSASPTHPASVGDKRPASSRRMVAFSTRLLSLDNPPSRRF